MDKPYPRFIFHHPKFIFRNPETTVVLFEERSAEIYFSHNHDSLISLDASPFGSFVTDRGIKKDDLLSCLKKIEQWSGAHNITTVLIRSFPNAYQPRLSALIKETLLEFSFKVLYEDIAQVIDVTPGGRLALNTDKKRRLRNSDARGFQFRSLPPAFLEEGYSLIVQSRKNKGYPVTMSFEGVKNMFALFPDEYLLFGVFDKERMIAASVSVKISKDILYCFYLGDDLAYRTHSPVTILVTGIYEYCKANDFSTLDLGLSTDKGIMNKGLYTFKKTFGTVDSPKLTFIKEL